MKHSDVTGGPRLPRRIEWPTLFVAAATYGGFGFLTWHYAALPWWAVLPCAAFVVCLHGSLQHEAVHGHPTPWAAVNEALVFPSLWLWMPFRTYRDLHLAHHNDEILTDPLDDPESYYMTPEAWARQGPLARALLWAHNTLAGRLLLGPFWSVYALFRDEVLRLARGDRSQLPAWALHLVGCGLVLVWVVGVCGIPIGEYLLLFAYPGLSLTLLRSFLEHQARPEAAERSVLIEAGPVMSLVFLNNNLHALHHAEPGLAWFRLPARYRERRQELLTGNGGYRFSGYGEIAARYLLRPKEHPMHPIAHAPAAAERAVLAS